MECAELAPAFEFTMRLKKCRQAGRISNAPHISTTVDKALYSAHTETAPHRRYVPRTITETCGIQTFCGSHSTPFRFGCANLDRFSRNLRTNKSKRCFSLSLFPENQH